MTIQLNSDKNLTIHEAFRSQLNDLLSEELSRFSGQITRLEVHLSDENGNKDALNDKRCLLEARLEGMQPIAVTELANTHELAVAGAIDKLITSLDTILGRLSKQ
ncbi:MAG: HPF/RaiA family ribosome-associated protein [Chitinophagaceae bacterium]|nr:HPF/RaiA family ribosome-associated protein [Chitinophagaceae bacterium]MBL0202594.1 HPF/RaiA family ribosome-associated protein [Chitinophagaceae bacterium]